MKPVFLITFLAAGVLLASAQITPPSAPPRAPLPPSAGCNNGRGCTAKGDAGAQCLPGDQTKPSVCKCSPGFVGAECIAAADQSGKIIKDEEKYLDDLKRQQFLANQTRLCTDAAAKFFCPPTPPQPQAAKDARLANLNQTLARARKVVDDAKSTWQRQRCKDCADSSSDQCKPRRPACSGSAQTDSAACCEAFNLQKSGSRAQKEIERILAEIKNVESASLPPAPTQIFNSAAANTCVSSPALCYATGNFPALVDEMEKQQKFCEASDQKFCRLLGCVAKNAPCVPEPSCPVAKPVRCPMFGAADGSAPCVAIGTSCPTDGKRKQCEDGLFPHLCPSGLSCAAGPVGTRAFYNKCMGDGSATRTSTWNGCPPQTVACRGRPFVCAPLNGTRTVEQMCEAKPGAYLCPQDQVFCGYERDGGQLSGGQLKSICLPSNTPGIVVKCPKANVKPLPKEISFGRPNTAFATQTIDGALPDGSAGRVVAKFGVDRGTLGSDVPAFFTGDGTQTTDIVAFSVGPVADSVAQFGPFADAVDSGRLLSPIVSITPSEPVVINTEAAAKGLGLFLIIPLNDQGNPSDLTRSLSNQTNCDAVVKNLAVFSINDEADSNAVPAGRCISDFTASSGTQLCSCKFLVPHFSAFAVVDTSPSNAETSSSTSFSSRIALNVTVFVLSALILLFV